jgi:hypothetical protein
MLGPVSNRLVTKRYQQQGLGRGHQAILSRKASLRFVDVEGQSLGAAAPMRLWCGGVQSDRHRSYGILAMLQMVRMVGSQHPKTAQKAANAVRYRGRHAFCNSRRRHDGVVTNAEAILGDFWVRIPADVNDVGGNTVRIGRSTPKYTHCARRDTTLHVGLGCVSGGRSNFVAQLTAPGQPPRTLQQWPGRDRSLARHSGGLRGAGFPRLAPAAETLGAQEVRVPTLRS